MSRAARISQWLADHPGWHFAGDVADGLGATGKDRSAITKSLWVMSLHRHVRWVGRHGTKRYTLGRPARKYDRQGDAHAN